MFFDAVVTWLMVSTGKRHDDERVNTYQANVAVTVKELNLKKHAVYPFQVRHLLSLLGISLLSQSF
jgi:hypothetical protein